VRQRRGHGDRCATIRFVQIGSASGGRIALRSAVLRAAAVQLMGSGTGSLPIPRMLHAIRE
jgi:hypothetical protein